MSFPDDFFEGEPLDPNEERPCQLRFKLRPNYRVVTATSDVVDEFARDVDVDSKVVIMIRSFGRIIGNLWGVTAYVRMSSEDIGCCEVAWIRFRGTIDATPPLPTPIKFDMTWGLRIKQH